MGNGDISFSTGAEGTPASEKDHIFRAGRRTGINLHKVSSNLAASYSIRNKIFTGCTIGKYFRYIVCRSCPMIRVDVQCYLNTRNAVIPA